MVDVFLPSGTHIRETEAFADTFERIIQAMPGVTHVSSFIGGGGFASCSSTPRKENRAFVQFLVDVDDPDTRSTDCWPTFRSTWMTSNPNANAVAKKFLLGPGQGGRIQTRFSGPDPAELRELADQARQIFEDDGGAVCVRSDWRRTRKGSSAGAARAAGPAQRHHPRRSGPSAAEPALRDESSVSIASRAAPAAGIYPQETRLLPIVARPPSTNAATSTRFIACRSGARSRVG